jgi:hypothetical protein
MWDRPYIHVCVVPGQCVIVVRGLRLKIGIIILCGYCVIVILLIVAFVLLSINCLVT